ncbi:MAG: hypothetical protein Fur0022_43880 [Anaerolineales bacterium]
MSLSRRSFLKLAGLVAAGATLSACQPLYAQIGGPVETFPSSPFPLFSSSQFTALSRLTFGPRLSERQRVANIGLAAWIEEQLAHETIDNGPLDWRMRDFDLLKLDAATLAELGDALFDDIQPENIILPFRQATLLRQVYSRRQLYEVMVEFWTDHFNIAVTKSECWYLKVVDDREVIRKHALGTFPDLLHASAKSPAMLIYLDNQANQAQAPNENYAREVMELHTLGVNSGYTQNDVMELARCFTGWTVGKGLQRGKFKFNPDVHDNNPKTVLGHPIQPTGLAEAEQVLDLLAEHPATAHYLATKLVRRFIADHPPANLVQRTAQTFLQTRGDIKAALRTLLLDGLAAGMTTSLLQPKFKRPVNFMVSALRMLNAETDGSAPLQAYLSQMGQAYYDWPTPDGPPDTTADWQGNLLQRWKFALALARNEIDNRTQVDTDALLALTGASDIETFVERISPLVLGVPLAPPARTQLAAALRHAGASDTPESASAVLAGLIASPAFQWR